MKRGREDLCWNIYCSFWQLFVQIEKKKEKDSRWLLVCLAENTHTHTHTTHTYIYVYIFHTWKQNQVFSMLEITYFEKPLTMIDRDNHKANKDRVKYAHGDSQMVSNFFARRKCWTVWCKGFCALTEMISAHGATECIRGVNFILSLCTTWILHKKANWLKQRNK